MNNIDKWLEWNRIVGQYRVYGVLREGQMYFNALFMVDPELSSRLTNTEYDCFYDDKRCEAFLNKLMTELDEGEKLNDNF